MKLTTLFPNSNSPGIIYPHQVYHSFADEYFNDPSSGRLSTIFRAWQAATGSNIDAPEEIIELLGGER